MTILRLIIAAVIYIFKGDMEMIELIIAWIICGALGYGLTFAFYQKTYPTLASRCESDDRDAALFVGMCGVIGLIAVIAYCGMHNGLMYKSHNTEITDEY